MWLLSIIWDCIRYKSYKVPIVLGEIVYGNKIRSIAYDFSKAKEKGLIGIIYYVDIVPEDEETSPHFFFMEQAVLSINRFNGNKIIEGTIKKVWI